MEILSLALKENIGLVNSILKKSVGKYEEQNLFYSTIDKVGDTYIYKFCTVDSNYDRNMTSQFYDSITSGVLDVILKVYINKLLKERIKVVCDYLDSEERKKIEELAKMVMKNDRTNKDFQLEQSTSLVVDKIRNYFRGNNYMILEGFVKFRLKFLVKYLDDVILRTVEEYFVEQEYNEFVKILRYFVEIQEPKIDLVNVLLESDGKYLMYDDKQQIINNDYLKEIVDELSDSNISYDDLLISALITIAPKNVIIHIDEDRKIDGVLKIISSVFDGRVEIKREHNFGSSFLNKIKDMLIKEK